MTTAKHKLRIERVFDAPRELVWEAWTKPGLVMQWWGPNYFTSPACKIDLRVGGKFSYCMRGPDGTDYWNGGIYREIDPFKKIVCSIWFSNEHGDVVDPSSFGFNPAFPKEQHQTVTFEDLGERTKLTIVYEVESDEVMEIIRQIQMKEGWETSFDKFARVLAHQKEADIGEESAI